MFTGRRLDILDSGSLKIQYSRARYYNPNTGRFISRDPLGTDPAGGRINLFNPLSQYKNGMSLYEYVGSAPINYADPYGLKRVIVLLNGQDFMGWSPPTLTTALRDEPWVRDRKNNIVQFFQEDADWGGFAKNWILHAAKCSNKKCCHKIIIVGHSNGGDGARKVAKQLDGFANVALLFLFDPVGKPWHVGPYGYEPVSGNVKRAINYHQRSDKRRFGFCLMQGYMITPGDNRLWVPPYRRQKGPNGYYPHTEIIYFNKHTLANEINSIH